MSEDTLLDRRCASCGGDAMTPEISSATPAETLPIEALSPYWRGLFKEKVFFTYARCGDCGLLFAPKFFTPTQLAELYASMEPNMDLVPTDALEATQRGYLEAALAAGANAGGYLEIGPDVGYLAGLAAELGHFERFWLFEPNVAVHGQLAAATGGRPHVIATDMDDLSAVPDGTIGLAVMVHVLDHMLDPAASLRAVRDKLRPGGTLLIVTHNEGSLLRRVMGHRWPPFCLQHPQLFEPRSIAAMLDRAGFAGTRVSRSVNHFPIDFMVRQAAWTVGLKLDKVPLPKATLGLRLGNMLTLAQRPPA